MRAGRPGYEVPKDRPFLARRLLGPPPIYYIAPNRKSPRWRWARAGGLLATAVFLLAAARRLTKEAGAVPRATSALAYPGGHYGRLRVPVPHVRGAL